MTPARTSSPRFSSRSLDRSPTLSCFSSSLHAYVTVNAFSLFPCTYVCLLCPCLRYIRETCVTCRYIFQKLRHVFLVIFWIIGNTTVCVAWMTRNCLCSRVLAAEPSLTEGETSFVCSNK